MPIPQAASGKLRLTGIGNPLIDLVIRCDQAFLRSLGFSPGSVNHIPRKDMESVLGRLPPHDRIAGGGAANTCRIASMLGADCAFAGCVGEDELAGWYESQLARDGVLTTLSSVRGEGTGIFCTFIHSEEERTLVVAPGAALRLEVSGLDSRLFRQGGILLAEGFLARDPELLTAILRKGAAAGMRCALDLGSPELARTRKKEFFGIVDSLCDIVFANEAEFGAFTGAAELREAARLLPASTLFVVKKGARGAACLQNGRITDSPAFARAALDETGAGDAFAAGFLCAMAAGMDTAECLRRANGLAGQTVLVHGAGLSRKQAEEAFSRS